MTLYLKFCFFIIRLVKTYLLHYGYEETLNAFNLATQTTVPPIHIDQENAIDEDDSSYALKQRKNFRQVLNLYLSGYSLTYKTCYPLTLLRLYLAFFGSYSKPYQITALFS